MKYTDPPPPKHDPFAHWPDWANYRTTDANGAVYYWEERPEAGGVIWWCKGQHEQDNSVVPNWRDSLEERER